MQEKIIFTLIGAIVAFFFWMIKNFIAKSEKTNDKQSLELRDMYISIKVMEQKVNSLNDKMFEQSGFVKHDLQKLKKDINCAFDKIRNSQEFVAGVDKKTDCLANEFVRLGVIFKEYSPSSIIK